MPMQAYEIEELLRQTFPDAQIQVDGSDGVHMAAMVVDESFRGKNRVQQQRAAVLTANLEGLEVDFACNVPDSEGLPIVFDTDEGPRADTTIEGLAKLKPVFDRRVGHVTAGKSSQITDGAALLLLASERAVESRDLPVLGPPAI